MTIEVAKGRASAMRRLHNRSNGGAGEMRCPTCGSPLSGRAFEEITARLSSDEKTPSSRPSGKLRRLLRPSLGRYGRARRR